jgi:hypothetical protein
MIVLHSRNQSMPELMAHQVALRRFSMWLAVVFGSLALGLAIVGTYGADRP